MRAVVAPVLALGLLLAACAQPQATPTDESRQPQAQTQAAADTGPVALGLVNLWRVGGAEGERGPVWLRIDGRGFQLWRACGMIGGSWRATDTLFIASITGWSDGCGTEAGAPAAPWLESAAGYRAAGDGWELLDAEGGTLATLTVDGAPEPIASVSDSYTRPPEITEEVLAALARPEPLPAGLTAVRADELAGRWVPFGVVEPTDPYVDFQADGRWRGSDGCNGTVGRWAVDGDGALLATSGWSTLIGCEGAPVPTWVAAARLAGMDGAELVLLDADGTELGRLGRGLPPVTADGGGSPAGAAAAVPS